MNHARPLLASLLTLVVLGSGTSQALPPAGNTAQHPHPAHGTAVGERVRMIPAADQISGWRHIDDQHVVVEVTSQGSYLLTLADQCHGLSWAPEVAVTMSDNTIWAGFDAVTANGMQCHIRSIDRIDGQSVRSAGSAPDS